MNDRTIPYHIPKPPKGVGFSHRFLIAIVAVLVSVLILFFYFLNHFAPQTSNVSNASFETNTSNNDNAFEAIQQIEREGSLPREPRIQKKSLTPSIIINKPSIHPSGLSDEAFVQASEAPSLVYHRERVEDRQTKNDLSSQTVNEGLLSNGNEAADPYQRQNGQSEKKAFLTALRTHDSKWIHSKVTNPVSPFELKAGSIIPATLVTGIQSDLPGMITAKVRRHVFDTVTGNYLLIPQGTTLIGMYDSNVTYGQSRVLIAWSRLIFPNGQSFDLEGQPGVDLQGFAGLHDKVNHHFVRLFGSALLMSAFTSVSQLTQPRGNTVNLRGVLFADVGQSIQQIGTQLTEKNVNIQPTISIRPGSNFNVLLTRDMVLPNAYSSS